MSVTLRKPSKRKEIVDDIGTYAFGSQATQFISMIAGILTRNFLGPMQMGMWSTLQIVLDYAKYTTLGTTEAVSREIPYYLGKKDGERAAEVKDVVTSFSTLAAVLTAIGIVIYAVLFRKTLPAGFFWGLIFVALLVILQRLNNLMVSLLRAYRQFRLVSRQMIWSAIVNATLVAVLSYQFKLYGFMWAMVFSFVFNVYYIARHYDFQFRYRINRSLYGLIAFGMPLMLLQVVGILLRSIDKIVIVKMLGFEAMGFYSVAILVANYLGQIPNSIGIVMVPHFHEKYGVRDSIADVKNYVDKSVRAFSYIMPLFIGLSWIAIPVFVSVALRAYVPGISSAQYLITGIFFAALTQSYGNFIVVIKKHLLIFPVTIVTTLIAAGVNILAVAAGWGIAGVAIVTSLVLFLNFLFLFLLSGKWLYSREETWKVLSFVMFRFAYLCGSLALIDCFVRFPDIFVTAAVRAVLFLALSVPMIFQFDREFRIFRLMKEKIIGVRQFFRKRKWIKR